VTVTATATSDTISFNEAFTPDFANVTLANVTVDGRSIGRSGATQLLGRADRNGMVVTIGGLSRNETVTVEYTLAVSSSVETGISYSIAGNITSGTTTKLGTDTLRIRQTTSLSGAAGRYDDDTDGQISITELGTAAADYARDTLTITELGEVAAVYARS